MTKDKEAIYRRLLYVGILDIRNFSHRAFQETPNPWLPSLTQAEMITYVAALSDWLHNLAMYSARNFEGWNDEHFAIGYEEFCIAFNVEKYPALIHDVMKHLKNL